MTRSTRNRSARPRRYELRARPDSSRCRRANVLLTVERMEDRILLSISPPADIVAWWPGDGSTADIVGGHSGTLVGGAGYASGEVSQSFSFNGTDGFVQVPDSDLWAFGSHDFSINAWINFNNVRPSTVGNPAAVFMGNDEGGGNQTKWTFALGGGQLYFHINDPATGFDFLTAPFSPSPGQWYNVGVTRSGSTFTFYVDGAAIGTATSARAVPNANAPLTIGESEGNFFMDGLIDEAQIYDRALSPAEVASISAGGADGLSKGPLPPYTFVVSNTNDSGPGSLRQAILDNNADTANPSIDTIDFAITGSGVQTIQPLTDLPSVTHSVVIDGYSQPGSSRNTLAVGDNAVLMIDLSGQYDNNPYGGVYATGLVISADNSTVQGLVVNSFGNTGIAVPKNGIGGPVGVAIQGCFVGTDPSGTVARPNGFVGINAAEAPVRIGTDGDGIDGTGGGPNYNDYAERNIISGNGTFGVRAGSPAGVAVVAGNYIGTDHNGTSALPNGLLNPAGGIGVEAGPGSRVGVDGHDADPIAERNIISGNNASSGNFDGGVTAYAGSVIAGNYIGVDATGLQPLGNANFGVVAEGGALIGTDGDGVGDGYEGNVISGNYGTEANGAGIAVLGSGNQLAGNYIGTDPAGTLSLGAQSVGVAIESGSHDNVLGIDADHPVANPAGQRNVISGNLHWGVVLFNGAYQNVFAGNYIGTNPTGTAAVPNGDGGGIMIIGGSHNIIGTDSDGVGDNLERNIISGNDTGIDFLGDGNDYNIVAGNYIGLDVTGTRALPNRGVAVFFGSGGGTITSGIGNRIGVDPSSGNPAAGRNVIAGPTGQGIWLRPFGGALSQTIIAGNYIGTDVSGERTMDADGQSLGGGQGVIIEGAASTQVEGNVIGGWTEAVQCDQGATGTLITGNWIGSNAQEDNIGNGTAVYLTDGTTDTQVGGPGPLGNTIAFNGGAGVAVTPESTGNSIRGNSIHDNAIGISVDPGTWPFPVLSAAYEGASTVVMGALKSTPNRTFTIDFYSNPAPDSAGYFEGQSYLGSMTVTTDPTGYASIKATSLAPAGLGQGITATATLTTYDASNNPIYLDTSEFSQGTQVTQATTTTTLTASANPSAYGQAVTFKATIATPVTGLGTPTGSVQFVVDGSNFGAPVNLVNGAATSPAINSLGAGNHTVTAVYSGDTEFIASTAPNLTQVVNPAALDIYATSDNSKTYDGTTSSSQAPTFQMAGEPVNTLYNGDTLTGLVQVFASKDVLGTNGSTLQVTGYTVNDGNSGKDYTVTTHTASGTVTPAKLTITGSGSQMYGGTSRVFSASYSGLVPADQTNGTPNSGVLSGKLSYATTVTTTSLVGTYTAAVTPSGVTATNYAITFAKGDMVVNPQSSVQATYTGLLYVATASSTTSTATVGLSVTVKDFSGGAGDIRNATVTFVNRADGSTIAANLPVSLVNPTDITTGTASYNWSVNIGTNNSQSYTIGIIVGNDYSRNSSADDAVVTVSKPQAGSATGGGYLVNQNSAGVVPGDPGANTNFGFNAKNGSKGLQGQSNIIVRYQGHVFQYNTTSITSLTFPSGKTADYAGTGTIQDITSPSSPVTLYTGATLQVTMTDNGEPGSNDTIGITIWTPGGALWFSSNWNGTATVEQAIGNGHGGGNLQVRPAQELAGTPAANTTGVAPLTLGEIQPIAAEAIARWAATGVDPQRLSVLNHAVFQIDDLTGSDLAWERQGVIALDRTADGYGWFIDPTPGNDSEFGPGTVNSPARGHIDLLSVVAHEMGHLLGFGEDDGNGVTGEYLAPGVRHVPVAVHPPLGPAATTSDSASMNPTMPGRHAGVNPASLSVASSSAAMSQVAVTSRFSSTIDGFMAWDAALAEWFSGETWRTSKNKLVSRMNV